MIFINVDTLIGDGLEPTLAEAVRLANMLDVGVKLSFNELEIWVRPGDSSRVLATDYKRRVEKRAEWLRKGILTSKGLEK